MKLVHWPLMGGLLHLVQPGGDWAGPQPGVLSGSFYPKAFVRDSRTRCTIQRSVASVQVA